VNNHVVPYVKFLSPDMTNLPNGNMEGRNVLPSFPSFWMPNFSDPSEDRTLVHIIVIHEHVKPLINCYRSNTANALKRNMLGGKTE
jgi:hypothetical protein